MHRRAGVKMHHGMAGRRPAADVAVLVRDALPQTQLSSSIKGACFPVPTWHHGGHGAQRRGWEERSHAQHPRAWRAPDLPRSEHRGRLTASRVLRPALALLALFEAIAVAIHFEDVDVVGQPIEQRAGQPLGADDFMMPFSSKELCVVPVLPIQ